MFIKKLDIFSAGELIRSVSFRRGLNLILDKSDPNNLTESSNSVGKTTALRVIDFCFGSNGTDIYQDEEFRQNLNEVRSFLFENSVTARLEIENDGEIHTLERGFGTPQVMRIDGKDFDTEDSYKRAIEVQMFGIESSKPSLREIMPKFIRKTSEHMSKTIKFADKFTTDDRYEVIYAYLFDFENHDAVGRRSELRTRLSAVTNKLSALRDGRSTSYYKEALRAIEREIFALERRKNEYDISDLYEEKIKDLRRVRGTMAGLSTRVGKLETQIQMHLQTIADLKQKSSKADPATLKELYEEAGRYTESLHRDYEQLLQFHNSMIINKVKFAEANLKNVRAELKSQRKKLDEQSDIESGLLRDLSRAGALGDLETLHSDLSRAYERRGSAQRKVTDIVEKEEAQSELSRLIGELETDLKLAMGAFEENIAKFNEFFSEYSKRLYEQSFVLTQKETGSLRLQIDNIEGNVGSGKKKAAIAAFDLAYIDYAVATGSRRPRFVIHNGIEEVGNNQLQTLFEISNREDRQYIVALISDRLDFLDEEFVRKHTALQLTESDKFFRF